MKNIVMSDHAHERMIERKISPQMVYDAITKPSRTEINDRNFNAVRYIKVIDEVSSLIVVIVKDDRVQTIITTFIQKKG
jgi:hypothetical protein